MKLTNAQYKDLSECIGIKVNEETNFELLCLQLQQQLHGITDYLKKLITMNQSLITDNEQLIDQNKYLINKAENSNTPAVNRILN